MQNCIRSPLLLFLAGCAPLGRSPAGATEVSDRVECEASIAPLQSAITIASDGGARIKLDIPEDEMPAIMRLTLLRGKRLKVTFEAIDDDD